MIVVGTTTVAWKQGETGLCWLETAEEMVEDAKRAGHDLTFFVALELDGRGQAPFADLLARLEGLQSDIWTFTLDDGATEIDSNNRLPRICAGRNFVQDYAMRIGASRVLFLDTDTRVPGDCISKLLEVEWPMVGGEVPQYGLHGDEVECIPRRPPPADSNGAYVSPPPTPDEYYDFPVQRHWNTAGFLLVGREVFRQVRWRVDGDAGMTDDPCYDADATRLGFPTLVRKDVVGSHVEWLIPVESRPSDRSIVR